MTKKLRTNIFGFCPIRWANFSCPLGRRVVGEDQEHSSDTRRRKKKKPTGITKFKVISILLLIASLHLVHDVFTSNNVVKQPNTKEKQYDKKYTPSSSYRVPADMWGPYDHPNPSKNDSSTSTTITWKPQPLPNCCHDPRASKSSTKHSKKFLQTCNLDTNGIPRYRGPGHNLTPHDLINTLQLLRRDLILIGDSLTRQWFEQLSCYLGSWKSWRGFATEPVRSHRESFETTLTEWMMDYRPEWRTERGNTFGNMFTGDSAFGSFSIKTKKKNEKRRVIIQNNNVLTMKETIDIIGFYNDVYPKVNFDNHHFKNKTQEEEEDEEHHHRRTTVPRLRRRRRRRPIFVINMGVHYNMKRNENYTKSTTSLLRENLSLLVKTCRDRNAYCIFRETSPQHFVNRDGDGLYYEKQLKHVCMERPPEDFDTLNRWRNRALYDAVNDDVDDSSKPNSRSDDDGDDDNDDDDDDVGDGRGGLVTIMPLFDRISYLTNAHLRDAPEVDQFDDCTHFVSNPEYWEPWHVSLTQVLLDIAYNKN